MKSKSINEIVSLDSLALTAIITYWKDYDKNTVLISYLELKRRNFNLDSSIEKKLDLFSQKQGKSIDELLNDYKSGDDFLSHTEFYNDREIRLKSEKENREKITEPNHENVRKKSILTPLNICLFLGLCIGCYLPIKYLIQSSDTVKCSNSEVKQTVNSMLVEKMYLNADSQLENIITTSVDKELNSCECQGTIPAQNFKGKYGIKNDKNIFYSVQKTDDGETMVSIYPN